MTTAHDENALVCARCHRALCSHHAKVKLRDPRIQVRKYWPEGAICVACHAQAVNTHGQCADCGTNRLLPGRRISDGNPVCTDCAGGLGDFTCRRCGQEEAPYRVDACARCVLTDRLTELLDDGSGAVLPELEPLFQLIRTMSWPSSRLTWLRRKGPASVLSALARGEVPLTHGGISTLRPWRSVIYLRDLLIDCGVLPPVDRFLLLFEQWLSGWLVRISNPEHRRLLERFATWHVLRRLRLSAREQPINSYRANNARRLLRVSALFLDDLAEHGRRLDECTQADIDRWFTAGSSDRKTSREFLRWARQQRELPRLHLPTTQPSAAAPLSQHERLAHIRRVLTDEAIPDADRVLALLILLYAQPLIRIARLTTDDIIRGDDEVLLRLGDPPTSVPQPFAEVLTRYLNNRLNLTTAGGATNPFLFPGRRTGQPLHTTSLRLRLRNLGLPNLDGRTAAIRQFVLQAPAPVIAGMLGYHPNTTELLAAEAGATWKRYAPGDHSR